MEADIIRPLNLHKFIGVQPVGCGDSTHRCRKAVRYEFVGFAPTFASHNNRIFYTTRVSAFSFYLKKKTPAKEKQTSRSRSTPATPRRSTQPATLSQRLGTFARKLASLKQYGLVRLASQAVQPSQNIVAYRPWIGRYAPCFSPTSPRFIRHWRRLGDVARSSQLAYRALRRGYCKSDYKN